MGRTRWRGRWGGRVGGGREEDEVEVEVGRTMWRWEGGG